MARWLVIGIVIGLAVVPVLPLVAMVVSHESTRPVWTPSFAAALWSTLKLGGGITVLSLVLGLPTGLLVALYQFPGRLFLLLLQVLPLLLPSFLLCIGWSNLGSVHAGLFPAPHGLAGCVFVMGIQAVPLPLLATWAACSHLTASQIEAARLGGGEWAVWRQAGRACGPVALLAALFGGILGLSDPGAPLILGTRSLAVEIRTSFAALYDYSLAARQCLVFAGVVLLLATPVLVFGARYLAAAVLARQMDPARPYGRTVFRWLALGALLSVLGLGVVLPAIGLCLPAWRDPTFARAWRKVTQTALTTGVFMGGAGVIAVVLGTVIAAAAGTDRRRRLVALGALLALLAMPPALAAIGTLRLATQSPPALDWLLRGQAVVAGVLGLRFLPVATVTMMRAVGSLSPSWIAAARLHGVRTRRFLVRVVLPLLTPAILVGFLLVAILAAADITTTHLLQPPGKQSLTVAIFTVMANSPEGLVASLCLVDLVGVTLLLLGCALPARLRRREHR